MKDAILKETGNDESAAERLKVIIEKVENNIKVSKKVKLSETRFFIFLSIFLVVINRFFSLNKFFSK